MALKHHYDEYLEELAAQGLDPNGDPIRPHPGELSDRELKDRLMDKIRDQIERHELDSKAQGIPEATRDLPPGAPKELKDFLEDNETDWHRDRISEHRRKWLEDATKADPNTSREQLERLYARDPEIPPSDPEALERARDQWKREWNLESPKSDPNETLEDLSSRGAEGGSEGGSENAPDEMLDDLERRLGGGKGKPGGSESPGGGETPGSDASGTGEAGPGSKGDGGMDPGGRRTWERGAPTIDPKKAPPPPPGAPPPPPGLPPTAPPGGGSGPSIPLAPLAPLIVAGGTEVLKTAGKGIIGKVIVGIVVIVILVGGTKVILDATGGSRDPGGKPTVAGGGPFNGYYSVSERDRNAVCPEGTSFRNTLAQGQPGPNFNYFLRIVSDASSVSLGPEGGDPIVTADLAADGSFTGPSPVGSQFPVHGRFQGGSGPGGTFTMEWTVPYGAGTCTTDVFGQWTSS